LIKSQGLVFAGIGDLSRPAEKVSLPQSGALTATGLTWARYSTVIIPKNWSLFAVNVFVASTGTYQLTRAIRYNLETKNAELQELDSNKKLSSSQ